MEACVSNPMVSCAFPNYNGMKVVKFLLALLEAPSAVGKLKDWISFYSPATRGKGCTHSKGKSPRTQEQWWLFLLFVTVLHAPFYLSVWLPDQSFYLPFLPFSPCFPCAVTASLCSPITRWPWLFPLPCSWGCPRTRPGCALLHIFSG